MKSKSPQVKKGANKKIKVSTKRLDDGSTEVTSIPVDEMTTEVKNGTRHIGLITERDLREAAQIPDDYVTVVFKPNAWVQQDGKGPFVAYQAKGTFRPNPSPAIVDSLLEKLAASGPRVRAKEYRSSRLYPERSHLLEIGIPDLHLGLYSRAIETGARYNLKMASRMFLEVIDELLERARVYQVDKIIFPVGNDFLHIDTLAKATTNGTPQDVASSYYEIVSEGQAVLIEAINRLKERAPVEVISIPGNHDEALTFHVAQVLGAWFRKDENVSVDCGPMMRKYRRWGTNLIGWTHGRYEKPQELVALISSENPKDWPKTTHREIHLGHEHRMMMMEQTGVRLRWLPSLAAPSSWITKMGYNSTVRAAEAYLWELKSGYAGHISVSVSQAGKVL